MSEQKPVRIRAKDVGYLLGHGDYTGPTKGVLLFRPSKDDKLVPELDMMALELNECMGDPRVLALIESQDVNLISLDGNEFTPERIDRVYLPGSLETKLWGRGVVEVQFPADPGYVNPTNPFGRFKELGFSEI